MQKIVRNALVISLTIMLVSCVASRRPVAAVPLAEQAAVLQGLSGYALTGRVAITGVNAGVSAGMQWQQRKAASNVRLSGPLGLGATEIHFERDALRIMTSRGDKLEGEAAQQVLAQQLGFTPPLGALRYWVLGLPAPFEATSGEVRDAAGLLTAFEQQDWKLQFEEFRPQATAQGTVQVPIRLLAERADLRLRLIIDSWDLQ
jgi:outer membrane lipoprotein LolB